MKIVHVLSFVSVDGSYGGPVAVARQQCEKLAARGHEVTLFAGWDGRVDYSSGAFTTELHRAYKPARAGFGALTSPGLWRAAKKASADADVVHVHLARDFAAMPAALMASRRTPLVIQAHGMIRPSVRLPVRLFDGWLTRPTLRRSELALVLTDDEARLLPSVARHGLETRRVRNGVGESDLIAEWAVGTRPEILFCARLHERKRPLDFVRMARILLDKNIDATFSMIGPDEGLLPQVLRLIDQLGMTDRVHYEGACAPAEVLRRMSHAQVYVLPSVQEPFPMSVLEAMSVGLPSVITSETGISVEMALSGAALVARPQPGSLALAVADAVSSKRRWHDLSRAAREAVKADYSSAAMVQQLERHYRRAVGA